MAQAEVQVILVTLAVQEIPHQFHHLKEIMAELEEAAEVNLPEAVAAEPLEEDHQALLQQEDQECTEGRLDKKVEIDFKSTQEIITRDEGPLRD